MSAIVQTLTPFVSKDLLLEALETLGVKYNLSQNRVITDRIDYYGNQSFDFINGKYQFVHDSSAELSRYPWRSINFKEWTKVSDFLKAVEIEYNKSYERLLERLEEEERIREEERKKEYVESQRQSIIQKAKDKGYSIKEIKKENVIQLVLTKTTH
jgi:hypothetical protein